MVCKALISIDNHVVPSQRWELIKENKNVRKKDRKHALDQENESFYIKKYQSILLSTTNHSFCHLSIRPNWIYIKNEAKCLILICVFHFLPSFFLIIIVFLESYFLGRKRVFFFFLTVIVFFFLVESEFSFFTFFYRFLGRKRVFFLFSCFLFLLKFPPQVSIECRNCKRNFILSQKTY